MDNDDFQLDVLIEHIKTLEKKIDIMARELARLGLVEVKEREERGAQVRTRT